MLRGSACPPSPCASPSASPRRAVAPRSVAGKDRGEWTRFLEWSDSDGGDKATVEVTLLSGSASVAEVSVEAPDRPGLLGDIANTLSSSGLNIEKAKVTTPAGAAKNTFRVTCQAGEELTEPRLASLRLAVLNATSNSKIGKSAASTRPVPRNAAPPTVQVMSFEPPSAMADMAVAPELVDSLPPPPSPPALWSVQVDADDAPGLLSKLLAALAALQLDIRSADVRTTAGRVRNSFVTTKREGLLAQGVIDALCGAMRE